MTGDDANKYDELLSGANTDEGLVAVELVQKRGSSDDMVLFFRRDGKTARKKEPFRPYVIAAAGAMQGCPVDFEANELEGPGRLNVCAQFATWKDCLKARSWLSKSTGFSASSPEAPYLFLADPVQQFLAISGRTMFLGMEFGELRRMQVDIECTTTSGYEFCNAERPGDKIIIIAMSDESGWVKILSGTELDEKEMLEKFVELVRERDPDVIEGHNIFNFDLPYIAARAERCGVALALGRNGRPPHRRSSRLSMGERTISYERFDVFGRHVVDTLFLLHAYDIAHRSLDGFGLKEAAVHFGLAAKDRTYIDGSDIGTEFEKDPDRVADYARGDVVETLGLSSLLSRSNFLQAQMLPYNYQNVCVRGNATKIDSLMVREYLRQEHAVPLPDRPRGFEGGYTDMFVEGVVQNVHHCDIRSLYPSLMLTRQLAPRSDELGVFLKLLDLLKAVRLEAKEQMQKSRSREKKNHFDNMQATFKILINSFYGYLGFSQGRFSDFDAAEEVTRAGRELLRSMIEWLKEHKAVPIEIDTDGIYFVPPEFKGAKAGDRLASFRAEFAESLPRGIEVEFDGEYRAMYSYKMKNYALLTEDGEMIIKGAALKSRGLEPFQRSFLREVMRLKLEGHESEIPGLKARYEKALRGREWPIEKLARTERLQEAPATYSAKVAGSGRPKSAVYELALRSDREYRAGDHLSYYVTGTKKTVSVHENARLVSEWDPEKRDENVVYYVAKLDALYKKFGEPDLQGELQLETG